MIPGMRVSATPPSSRSWPCRGLRYLTIYSLNISGQSLCGIRRALVAERLTCGKTGYALRTHVNAIQKMISLRGGFGALGRRFQLVLAWRAIIGWYTTPSYPTQYN